MGRRGCAVKRIARAPLRAAVAREEREREREHDRVGPLQRVQAYCIPLTGAGGVLFRTSAQAIVCRSHERRNMSNLLVDGDGLRTAHQWAREVEMLRLSHV